MKKIFKLFTLIIVFITASNCCFALSIGKIEKLINNSDLDKTSTIAISIRNAENNNIIYEKNADKLLHPASTLKVPTTYFAINTLGYDYFFKTQFYKDSKNNLYIKLGADPLLKTSQLKEAFQKIKEKNLSTFNNLYIDDSIIDKKEFAPGWMWDDDVNPYTPKISAYNLDENMIKANITQTDDNTMTISTSSKYPMSIFGYIKKDAKSDYFEINRYNWNNPELVEIYGRTVIPRQISIPISSMRRYFIYNLDKIIDDNRITIQSTMYASNLVPKDAELLYEISNPITPTLFSILHKSNNVMAETLFKLAGGQKYNSTGTDELGIYAMIEFYKKLNINFNSVVIKDGSGISRKNLISTNWLTMVLDKIYKDKNFEQFKEYIAQAGDGTLNERLYDLRGEAWLKTGSLSNISTIAGYVNSLDGNTYSIAIFIENFKENQKEIKKLEDKIITLIYNR